MIRKLQVGSVLKTFVGAFKGHSETSERAAEQQPF